MKQLPLTIVCLLLLLFVPGACGQKEEIGDEKVPVSIRAGINTRASDAQWEVGDRIGVTMYPYEADVHMEGCFNIPFSNLENGSYFTPVSGEAILYYPEDGSKVKFRAYYPYIAGLPETHLYPVRLADQTLLPAIDLMTAEHLSGSSMANPTVNMEFYHRLSKLIFILQTEGDNTEVYEGYRLTVRGMRTRGTFDIHANRMATEEESYQDIFVPLREEHIENKEEHKRTAIVFPREAGTGVTVHLTSGNGNYFSGAMDPDLELEEGYKYLIKIIISGSGTPGGDGEPVRLETINIEPWSDGGEHILEAN